MQWLKTPIYVYLALFLQNFKIGHDHNNYVHNLNKVFDKRKKVVVHVFATLGV